MRAHSSDIVNTRGHWAVGTRWPVVGSKGDVYEVEMTDSGFSCDCIAFAKCKHIKSVEARFDEEPDC